MYPPELVFKDNELTAQYNDDRKYATENPAEYSFEKVAERKCFSKKEK